MKVPLLFGRFALDPREYRLTRDGQPVSLPPKPFDLLVALATRPGRLVTREELLSEVWKGVAVEQSSLNAAMSILRQALGEDAAAIIETVPGRGYRFIAPLSASPALPVAAPARIVRVAIVDDHEVVRLGVRVILESLPGFTCVGEAGTLADATALVERERPDMIVLDLMIGSEPSLDAIRDWLALAPNLRIVVLSMHAEDEYARRALAAGAHAYVMKAEMLGELKAAVEAVAAGGYWVSAKMNQAIVTRFVEASRQT